MGSNVCHPAAAQCARDESDPDSHGPHGPASSGARHGLEAILAAVLRLLSAVLKSVQHRPATKHPVHDRKRGFRSLQARRVDPTGASSLGGMIRVALETLTS